MNIAGRIGWAAYLAHHARRERSLPWWPPERLQALQDRRVHEIVAHAYATVGRYRRVMDERGLRPRDITTAADLAKLPLVGVRELSEDPDSFLSSTADRSGLLELTTTGTSGQAKRIRHDARAVFMAWAAGGRSRAVAASVPELRPGAPTVYLAPPQGTYARIRDYQRDRVPAALWRRAEPVSVSIDARHADLVAAINQIAPDTIVAFGRQLGSLYRRAHEANLPIHAPRLVWYGGDAMPDADRRLIEERFGIPVFSSYQSCEFLRIAFQCERRDGLHVSTDQVALRVVDADGRDVPPGTPGEAVVTGLVDRAAPLINFRLGDRVALATRACSCGRTLPRLASLDGRVEDLLVRRDGERVHESLVLPRLYRVPGLSGVAVVQRTLGRIDAEVVVSPGFEPGATIAETGIALRELAGDAADLEIRVVPVERIAAGPGGKIRAVTSLVDRDPDPG